MTMTKQSSKLRRVRERTEREAPTRFDGTEPVSLGASEPELGIVPELGLWGEFNPFYGPIIGAAVTEGAIMAARAYGKKKGSASAIKYAGLWGLGTGLAVGGAMAYFPRTRTAGYLALAVTAIRGVAELVRANYLEPKGLSDGLGYYGSEIADGNRVEFLGDYDVDGIGAPNAGLEIMGQVAPPALGATPMDVMGQAGIGFGMYQSEMTGVNSNYLG